MTAAGGCVLVVDDEFLIADLLCAMVEDMGLTVCGIAADADEAVALARAHAPRLVLMDVRLKGRKDGIDAATAICAEKPTPVIFITGSREPETVQRIRAAHRATILFKPITFAQLQAAVEQALG
jgi:CheY-like chemotaxis protein